MKKWIILISALALIVVIVIVIGAIIIPPGYSFGDKVVIMTSEYWITEKDGEYILLHRAYNGPGETWENGSAPNFGDVHVEFSSVDEMVADIKTGNFTDKERNIIRLFDWDPIRGAKPGCTLCDVFSPLEVILPAPWKVRSVRWYGDYYYIYYSTPDNSEVQFHQISESRYTEKKETFEKDCASLEQIEDRNAFFGYLGNNVDGTIGTRLCYTIKNENKILHIDERYRNDYSYTVPKHVYIFVEDNGYYFDITLSDLLGRPSVEFLSSLSVQKYEG